MGKRTTCYFLNGKLVVESPEQGVFGAGEKTPSVKKSTINVTQGTPKKSIQTIKPQSIKPKKQVERKPQSIRLKQDKTDYSHLSTAVVYDKLKRAYQNFLRSDTVHTSQSGYSPNPEAFKGVRIQNALASGLGKKVYDELLAEFNSRPLEERQAARKAPTKREGRESGNW